jgi:uncharacterized protein YdbL (DUF1318 family)
LVTEAAAIEHGRTLVAVTLPTGSGATYALTLPTPQECLGAFVTIKSVAKATGWTNGTVTVGGKTLTDTAQSVTFFSIGDSWVSVSDISVSLAAAVVDLEAARDAAIAAIAASNSLTFDAATGDIAEKTIVTPTLDTTCKWGYASTTVLGPLFYSLEGASAGDDCAAYPWLSQASHVCTATAAAIAIGDLVVLTASGQVVKTSAGAGKVVIGKCIVACGAGGGDVTVAPCAPYLTLA